MRSMPISGRFYDCYDLLMRAFDLFSQHQNVLHSCNTSAKLINRDCNCDSIEKTE